MPMPAHAPSGLVVVGCSAGGLAVCNVLLSGLAPGDDLALVIVQHRGARPSALAKILDRAGPLPVREPDDKAPLVRDTVYLAPADYHLLVENDHIELSTDAPVAFSRPSIDVSFAAAAASWGRRLVAVVLSGANEDGTAGAREVIAHGGALVVQDPATATAPIMPASVLAAGLPARVAAPEELAAAIRAAVADQRHAIGGAA